MAFFGVFICASLQDVCIFHYNKELVSFRGTDPPLLVKSICPQERRAVRVTWYSAKSGTYILLVACLTVFCLWRSVVKQSSLR